MTGAGTDALSSDISNPIINSPYEAPQQHFELGENGPTRPASAWPPAE